MLPGPSAGPRLGLELHRDPWSFELALAGLLPRHEALPGASTLQAELYWLGGQLSLCRRVVARLAACAGLEPGRISGTGSGVDEPGSAAGWWLAGTAGVRWSAPLLERGALSWQLGAGVAAALLRPEFGFDDIGVLHRPSAISGRVFLGLGWH